MRAHTQLDLHTTALLREAALWRVLARLFDCPDDHWRAEIATLARELDVDEVRAASSAIDDSATAGLYHSVFGPGGPAPPREASYHDAVELGSLLTDLAGYYEAFAYAPRTTEPLDHVAVELSFVSYLKFKEAYAHARGHDEEAEIAARAAEQFVADHLARIAAPLADLLDKSGVPYLTHASRLLATRVGPRRSRRMLPVLMAREDEQDGGLTCGLP